MTNILIQQEPQHQSTNKPVLHSNTHTTKLNEMQSNFEIFKVVVFTTSK